MGYAVSFVQFGNGFRKSREGRDFDFREGSGRPCSVSVLDAYVASDLLRLELIRKYQIGVS